MWITFLIYKGLNLNKQNAFIGLSYIRSGIRWLLYEGQITQNNIYINN